MDSQSTVNRPPGQKKYKAPRRSWTSEEELVLLSALKELVVRGWKCDNGFKAGYTAHLEQSMVQAFSYTNIKAEPHISSKITVWKKNYGSLSTMMSRSGFGWIDSSNTIYIQNDDIWNEYVKTDNNARTIRYKSWPYYKDWCEIFGKYRAMGQNAEGFVDIVQDILNEAPTLEQSNNDPPLTPNQNTHKDFPELTSTCDDESSASGKTNTSKKRKKRNEDLLDERFLDLMTSFCEKTDARLGDLSKRLGFEHDARSSRKEVFDALATLDVCSAEEKLAVANKLCDNTKHMDLFFNLDNEMKASMIKMILEGRL
ncbi:uncharacterized protein at2g29880 [Phtheirospermum japonicum]|uniref:Uncharacterized protein at2g29880 n=1 Tax=Phtheirospermum japonicum TaxID=374723 RepID=A0A830CGW6_9LAMI|nr:uncharacterized protein at2g29880 [Phtheirospermum japonicum]